MEASEQLKQVELSLIEISGHNPRKDVKGESFKELKASIAEHGILEPLLVRPKGKGYELVAGERRFTAAKELKLKTVPVAIRELDDHMARVLMLLENLQREDLAPLEEAAALEELLKDQGDGGMTQEELAKKLSKSQPWVANRLRLLKAPEKLKEYLKSGQMTPQHLISLLPYCDKEALIAQVLRKYDDKRRYGDGCSVEELQGYVENIIEFDDSGKFAFRPDKDEMHYKMKQLAKDMDLSACKDCKKTTTVEVDDGLGKKSKIRVCLETECFRPKVNEARKKVKESEHEKLEKAVKSGAVSTDKLRYGMDYKDMDYVHFPLEWCKGCPKMQKGTGSQRTITGSSHERICLMPRCLDERIEYHGRESDARNKNIHKAVEEGTKDYLKGRAAGLKKHELQFIINNLAEDSPQKKLGDKSEKQLEELLLREAIDIVSRIFKYRSEEVEVRKAIEDLPFKIEGEFSIKPPEPPEIEEEKPEPPKDPKKGSKKIAKEKREPNCRKKKGAS
jgi:ParB/RepB/Spo0J family partition protein